MLFLLMLMLENCKLLKLETWLAASVQYEDDACVFSVLIFN